MYNEQFAATELTDPLLRDPPVVLEVLGVNYLPKQFNFALPALGATANNRIVMYCSANPSLSTTGVQDGPPANCFAYKRVSRVILNSTGSNTSAANVFNWKDENFMVDLTDGENNGTIWLTSPNLTIYMEAAGSIAASQTMAISCELIYRLREVNLQTYMLLLTQQASLGGSA